MKPLAPFILLILLPVIGFTQKSRLLLGKELALKTLEESLKDTSLHNVLHNKTLIIPDSSTAVTIAESILFKIYGKKEIQNQRPYEIYKIENYWYISGTFPKPQPGGTFLIITDARDGKVIRITHGK